MSCVVLFMWQGLFTLVVVVEEDFYYLLIIKILLQRYNAFKHHWTDNRHSTILQVTACSLDEISTVTNKRMCSYDYKDMEGITMVSTSIIL